MMHGQTKIKFTSSSQKLISIARIAVEHTGSRHTICFISLKV